jgi:hypothetical protein
VIQKTGAEAGLERVVLMLEILEGL